jgi:hypothetical protein
MFPRLCMIRLSTEHFTYPRCGAGRREGTVVGGTRDPQLICGMPYDTGETCLVPTAEYVDD